MNRNFCFLLFLVIQCSASGQAKYPAFPEAVKVKDLMDDAVGKTDLKSFVAIAVNRKGQRVNYQTGKAVWTEQEPVTENHVFRIFSMTKLLTSIAAMQQVEQGKVRLDENLSSLLPEMAEIPILTDSGLVEGHNPITLRHLLTHTAGFGSVFTDQALSEFKKDNWKYKDLPRRFESGTRFLYGSSTNWVGKLVERLSGLDLEEYFRRNITGPLQMTRTSFSLADSLKPNVVSWGGRGPDGKQPLKEFPNRIPDAPPSEYNGSGGLFGSPADYNKLLQCLLNYGSLGKVRILKRETILEMCKNQIGDISVAQPNAFFNPAICCNLKGIVSPAAKWGLAWMIDNEKKSYGPNAGTVVWGGAANTMFYIDFKSGVAVSAYTQVLPFNDPGFMSLFTRFSEIIYKGK